MADIVLRNLEDGLKEKLRQRAASNQRSMNAELREIVSAALAQPRRSSRAELKKLAADIRSLRPGVPRHLPRTCCARAVTGDEMGRGR